MKTKTCPQCDGKLRKGKVNHIRYTKKDIEQYFCKRCREVILFIGDNIYDYKNSTEVQRDEKIVNVSDVSF